LKRARPFNKYATGTGQNCSTRVICYEIYRDVTTCDGARLTGFAGNDIPIEFHLPTDQSATHLASTPPVYWEIEAKVPDTCFVLPGNLWIAAGAVAGRLFIAVVGGGITSTC